MSIDSVTQAQLEQPILRWRVLAWLDFDGDPLRATSGLYDLTISGQSDAELNGTYFSIDSNLIGVGPVKHSEQGTETVEISLSGLLVNNADLLATIGNSALWQGRTARLWFYVVNENEQRVGQYIPYYTGYMDAIQISGSPQSQTITLTIENYLASISGSQGKTYLIQNVYDSGDTSAEASIAAGNGIVEGVISGGGAGGPGGSWPDFPNIWQY